MNLIEGKVALVTGGTRGIGLAIAELLLERGAAVYLAARGPDAIATTVASLGARFSDRIAGSAHDVREYAQVRDLFARVDRVFGGLDVLINNAAVASHSHVERMPIEEWQATIETNLSGTFYCCHEALPLMRRRGGGYVINVGSLAGTNAFAGGAAYCATKFGLIGFSESLMQEVRHDHIRVSCVMPGSVNTGFGRGGEPDPAMTWKLTAEDVATAVVELLETDPRALISRLEIRPAEPKK